MQPTARLYYDDSFLLDFRATVVGHGSLAGGPSVTLDRSAFFPEGGGQLADRGILGGLAVVDVQVDDAGVVHHRIEGDLPPIGSEVEGRIDRARRRLHMALHTGQHMLSRALADVARAATVSARLGETACTIDVDRSALDDRELSSAEDLVNAVVEDDVPVTAFFPTPTELEALPLRREPKVDSHVRVIAIGQFDLTPCGGTHCTRTAQVGVLRVVGVERYKGKMRIKFAAGQRARCELAGESDVLRSLGRDLSCGPLDVPSAIEKLRREMHDAKVSLGRARARLADVWGSELGTLARSAGQQGVIAVLDDAPIELVRAVAARISADPRGVALLAGRDGGGLALVAARGSASDFDCGAFVKRVAALGGGRGGGRPESAEGRLPAETDWPKVAEVAAAEQGTKIVAARLPDRSNGDR